jgi:hypothetical protein
MLIYDEKLVSKLVRKKQDDRNGELTLGSRNGMETRWEWWRNGAVTSKAELQGSEATSVHANHSRIAFSLTSCTLIPSISPLSIAASRLLLFRALVLCNAAAAAQVPAHNY